MSIIHQSGAYPLPENNYDVLLSQKVAHLKQLLTPFSHQNESAKLDNLQVFASAKRGFRMRAEFGIWHEGDDSFYTMVQKNEAGESQKIALTSFPIASEAINKLMPALMASIKKHPLLRQKLFQVEFLNTLAGDMLVTLIYHKKLDDDWLLLAQDIEKKHNCFILGRSRKQKLVVSQDFVLEKLSVFGKSFTYKQLEGGFTQPNAFVCQKMLTWACQQAQGISATKATDLLELYCGNGNFTLPLSQYFRKTLATEISKTSVAAAQWNITQNTLNNIAIARLSAEEFTQALEAKREFRRLKQADIKLADYDFSCVFVDPPRAGIDDDTLKLLANFEYIIYISCNPNTLADNLTQLTQTHQLTASALFDQFPYTDHIEAGVVLQKI